MSSLFFIKIVNSESVLDDGYLEYKRLFNNKDTLSNEDFKERFKDKVFTWKNYSLETKIGEKPFLFGGLMMNNDESSDLFVIRNFFKHNNHYTIDIIFEINKLVKPTSIDREPLFFTFSDELNAGFIVVWSNVIEYYQLGPEVKLIQEKYIDDISYQKTKLSIKKISDNINIFLNDKEIINCKMGGERIAQHNYEIPYFIRYSNLNYHNHVEEKIYRDKYKDFGNKDVGIYEKSLTRNFFRFGTLYYKEYSDILSVDLKVYDIKVSYD